MRTCKNASCEASFHEKIENPNPDRGGNTGIGVEMNQNQYIPPSQKKGCGSAFRRAALNHIDVTAS